MKQKFGSRVKFTEITSSTRQFAAILEARISLVKILDILNIQIENRTLQKVLAQVKKEVQSGSTLTDSFARFPDIFSDFYINMIRVGEITLQIDYMLTSVTVYLEKINILRRKLMQSLSYPLLIIMVAIGAVSFLLTYVVPTFADMYRDFEANLPTITFLLMKTSTFLTEKIWIFLLIFIGIAIGGWIYINRKQGHWYWDSLMLAMPLSGPIIKNGKLLNTFP